MGPARQQMPGCAGCPRVGHPGWGGTRMEALALQPVGSKTKYSEQVWSLCTPRLTGMLHARLRSCNPSGS